MFEGINKLLPSEKKIAERKSVLISWKGKKNR